MHTPAAWSHCSNLELAGGGWRLPTIGELRTLIRGCPATDDGGTCNVDDDCLCSSCTDAFPICNCPEYKGPAEGGCYWPDEMEGDCDWNLSSSWMEDNATYNWLVNFSNGGIFYDIMAGVGPEHARCVR
jgi:hypothetical protein